MFALYSEVQYSTLLPNNEVAGEEVKHILQRHKQLTIPQIDSTQ